jgi:hypothetical protein
VEVSPVYICARNAVVRGRIFTRSARTVGMFAGIVTVQAERAQIFARRVTRSNRAVHV